MAIIHPWGKVDWLFGKVPSAKWLVVASNSFEERCTALPLMLEEKSIVNEVVCIDVTSPNRKFDNSLKNLKNKNKCIFNTVFANRVSYVEHALNVQPGVWNDLAKDITSATDSVVLDITALPKRVFFFLLKKLIVDSRIKNIIACYTRAKSYKEGKLTEDAEPPSALPGFGRITADDNGSLVIVSVGYMSFNLNDYLEQGSVKNIKYLFPFPPGSPSFRRNWHLLHKIAHISGVSTKADSIKRIHAMDMFAALDWLNETRAEMVVNKGLNMDMIPLGPKTHSLAMALSYIGNEECSEVIYSQPRLYHPNYSEGIMRDANNSPEIYAYCLKADGIKQF